MSDLLSPISQLFRPIHQELDHRATKCIESRQRHTILLSEANELIVYSIVNCNNLPAKLELVPTGRSSFFNS